MENQSHEKEYELKKEHKICLGASFIILCSSFFVLGYSSLDYINYPKKYVPINGTIVFSQCEEYSCFGDNEYDDQCYNCNVKYEYVVEKHIYIKRESISGSYNEYKKGENYTLYYLLEDPAICVTTIVPIGKINLGLIIGSCIVSVFTIASLCCISCTLYREHKFEKDQQRIIDNVIEMSDVPENDSSNIVNIA